MGLTWLIIGPNREPSVLSLPKAFSSTVGNDKKRKVWPVGAVSKTITEYSIDLTCLDERFDELESWGTGEISLHNFSKTHGLINARDGECQVLHHRTHHSIGIRCIRVSAYIVDVVKEPVHCSTISCMALVGSISMAYRLSKPFTLVASFENFCPKASERL